MNSKMLKSILVVICTVFLTPYFSHANTEEQDPDASALNELADAARRAASREQGERNRGLVELRRLAANPAVDHAVRLRAHELCASFFLAERLTSEKRPALDHLRHALSLSDDPVASARLTVTLADQTQRLTSDPAAAHALLAPLAERLDEFPRDIQLDVLMALTDAKERLGRQSEATASVEVLLDRKLWKDEAQLVALHGRRATLASDPAERATAVAALQRAISSDTVTALAPIISRMQSLQRSLIADGQAALMLDIFLSAEHARKDGASPDLVQLRRLLAAFLQTEMNDTKRALAVLDANESLRSRAVGDPSLTKALHEGLGDQIRFLAATNPRDERIIPIIRNLLSLAGDNAELIRASIPSLVLGVYTRENTIEMAAALRDIIADNAGQPDTVGAAQAALVCVFLRSPENREEALREAAILLRLATDTEVTDAAEQLSSAFKVYDGHLGRANQLLRFLRFGPHGEDGDPGTLDDITNPTIGIGAPSGQDRTSLYERALNRTHDPFAQARLLVLLGRSDDAFETLLEWFRRCPATQNDVQAVADAISHLIISHTFDTDLAARLIAYLADGSTPDGDPTNPAKLVTEALRVAVGATAE